MRTGQPLVEMAGITKRYGGVLACDEVDLTIRSGEVHALLGENGAGKSTLMRVLSGDLVDYEGKITVEGHPVEFSKPAEAQRAGIAMIHQELDLVPALSVAGKTSTWGGSRAPLRRGGPAQDGVPHPRTAAPHRHRARPVPAGRPIAVGEQQLVVIARALS